MEGQILGAMAGGLHDGGNVGDLGGRERIKRVSVGDGCGDDEVVEEYCHQSLHSGWLAELGISWQPRVLVDIK